MKKINFKEMYPVYVKEILKEEINCNNFDEISTFFINKISDHSFATYIGIFNHYAHTDSIENGEIADNIKNAKNVIFCFGKKLPDPKILSVRPRSIGICETDSHFVISFLEAPNPALTKTMISWVDDFVKS